MRGVQVVVVPEGDGAGRVRFVESERDERAADLATLLARVEAEHAPRWVLPATEELYPTLLAAGVRLGRCHDLSLTEGILLACAETPSSPRNLAAAWARLHHLPEPPDRPPPSRAEAPTLFEPDRTVLPAAADPVKAALEVYADQQRRIDADPHPDRLRLLVAAESAGALAAAEMTYHGLPWRSDLHTTLLNDLLGPRPAPGARPARLAELVERIEEAFGGGIEI